MLCFRFLPHPMTTMTEEFKNGPSQTISRRTYLERERGYVSSSSWLIFSHVSCVSVGLFFFGGLYRPRTEDDTFMVPEEEEEGRNEHRTR